MVKRGANTNLNHDNWDEEDEREDRGTFTRASDEVLNQRVIKTAKRRHNMSSAPLEGGSKAETPNIFSSFGGFSKTPLPPASSFTFLQNSFPPKTDAPKSNPPEPTLTPSMTTASKNDEYLSKLRALNESVSQWIQSHVSSNPLCNLAPIFRDYERYFKEIEALNAPHVPKLSETAPPPSVFANTSSPNVNPFLKNQSKPLEAPKEPQKAPEFSFVPTQASNFKFGNGSSSSSTSNSTVKGFTFGGDNSAPFKFSNVAPPPGAASDTITIEDDDEEPPKADFVPVVEEGHVFTQRCKVFVKKGGAFAERGVGQLFLKPIPDKDKFQLIVRADTNIGNLLVNIVLSESIPTQRVGKNNVMIACVPLPEDKEPTPVLLRVKTAGDADALLEVLDKHKK